MSAMTLKDLQEFLAKAEDGAARDKALLAAFTENAQALAEILELLQKQGPDMAKAMTEAMKGMSFDMPAPDVRVNVPAPVVNLPDSKPRTWKFRVKYTATGALDEIVASSV